MKQLELETELSELGAKLDDDLEGRPEEEHRRALPGHPVNQEARGDNEKETKDEPRGREILSAQDEQGGEGRTTGEFAEGRQNGAIDEASILITRPHCNCPQITYRVWH